MVDDILVQAPDVETLRKRVDAVLARCKTAGITISKKKFVIGSKIKFAGHIISANGVEPDEEKVEAIRRFPAPTNVSELRSFLGMVNQLGHFIPDLAQMTSRLRMLLKKSVVWLWMDEHQQEFDKVKELLATELMVHHFDPALETTVLTDASRLHGTGYALMQEGRLIRCGSQALTATESRYSTIELELLGLVKAIQKCRYYLLGTRFKVVTDHKPLVGIFNKDLADISNQRIQRFRERVAGYDFDVVWLAGKDNIIADALSRAPVFPAVDDDDDEMSFCRLTTSEDPQLQPMIEAARYDDAYNAVISAVMSGKQAKDLPVDHPARAYKNVWDELSVRGDEKRRLLVYDGSRIVVPATCRAEILRQLHLPHAGIVKTRKAAQQLYYWPNLMQEVKQMVESCEVCLAHLPSKPTEEPVLAAIPEEAMEEVAADLFQLNGKHYLVLVDRYSGFLWCHKLYRLDTSSVTKVMDKVFLDFGYPCRMRTDGGPQFRGDFVQFCEEKGIIHELSSPYHPESNGLAENAVKTAKMLLQKTNETGEGFYTALAAWRRTPRADGASPAQLLLGRRPRGNLPALPEASVDTEPIISARREARAGGGVDEEEEHEFADGDKVVAQDPHDKKWKHYGTVVGAREGGKSYWVAFDGERGSKLRHRRFLRRARSHESAAGVQEPEHVEGPLRPCLRRSKRLQGKKDRHIHFQF